MSREILEDKNKKRAVIIGLDGVPFGLLKDLSETGVMPNTQRLIESGIFKKMRSSIPEVSSVAWSSIITGSNPAEHGIFGFTDFPLHTYRLSFPNFSHLKMPPFWEKDDLKKHVIINVPSTYPARKLRGILISGFVALDLERAVYPEGIIPHLKDMDYRVDVDSAKAHQSLELFLNDLKKTNEARISTYRHLWKEDWDTFMLVFTGTDRLLHFLWDAYENKEHPHRGEFFDYFKRVDEIIGEIASYLKEDDILIMLSDHGFERLEYDVYINTLLRHKGLLKLKSSSPPAFTDIDRGTKVFALDPARLYINIKGKYPEGSVDEGERELVIEEVMELFKGFMIEGRRVIKDIHRKEEIYSGPFFDRAPDLVLIGDKGFNLKASLGSEEVYKKGVFTGKHTQDDAFLFLNRKGEDRFVPRDPSVHDIVSILDHLKGGKR